MAVGKKKKKLQISKVKRSNQKRSKLARQGKLKMKRNKGASSKPQKPASQPPRQQPPEEEEEESDHGEDLMRMVEDEDLAFLRQAVTNRSYSILEPAHRSELKERRKRALDDSRLEEMYDERVATQDTKRTRFLLPIKTSSGVVLRTAPDDRPDEPAPQAPAQTPKAQEAEVDSDEEVISAELDDLKSLDTSRPLTTADLLAAREELLQRKKLHIGVLCSGVLENPELKVKNLAVLLDMLRQQCQVQLSVTKLVAVSLLEIFRDLLPAYQIKHQESSDIKLKKDTLKLQSFEKTLLKHYKSYLQIMEKFATVFSDKKKHKITEDRRKLGELAVKCLCSLLVTHPYFNFSVNLINLLAPLLDNPAPSVREQVAVCFKTVLKEDRRGEISLQIVRTINNLVKRRSRVSHCDLLSVLLALKIRDVNLDQEKEAELKQKKFLTHKQKLLRMSKRERKRSKRLEQLEKELLETKAEENKKTKQQFLTEITKVVFTIYFRVLKTAPSSKLLSVTLEGIAKFAHCINVEFYHDLVAVLDGIVEGDVGSRDQLHCAQTVFKILSGQGEVLNIDPSRFYTHLYRNMLSIHAGTSYADFPLLLHTLELALIQGRRRVSKQRQFAFTKRLAMLSLQLLHNGALSCLGVLKKTLQANKYLEALLDSDNTFGGVYLPELDEPEHCNASNTTLWELSALRRHYHPTVRKYTDHIVKGEGGLPLDIAKRSSESLFNFFSPDQMGFQPPVPVPRNANSAKVS